jgi:hypothetical protein
MAVAITPHPTGKTGLIEEAVGGKRIINVSKKHRETIR